VNSKDKENAIQHIRWEENNKEENANRLCKKIEMSAPGGAYCNLNNTAPGGTEFYPRD
jgi:hypothetical protein